MAQVSLEGALRKGLNVVLNYLKARMIEATRFSLGVFSLYLALAVFATQVTQAQTLKVLHTFTGGPMDGGNPYTGLLRDAAGNLYGTTEDDGSGRWCPNGCGTVFRIDANDDEKVLYNLAGNKDGAYPYYGALISDPGGNFYGTTYEGGAYGAGTVFEVSKNGGEKVLYSFKGGADGGFPWGGLVRDSAGNLYGTTSVRGSGKNCPYACGVVFKLDNLGQETVLHSFNGGADGEYPLAGLALDAAGNLYGTTEEGGGTACGGSGCGIVFEIETTRKERILYAFGGPPDGQFPVSTLIRDGEGNLYGTTFQGGLYGSGGTVFKIDPLGNETVLHSFDLEAGDGGLPYGGLLSDKEGNLYGTTSTGGDAFGGTIFEVSSSGSEAVLYSFTGGTDGYIPEGGLIRDSIGNLYGTTDEGGDVACFCGVVFQFTP
jgi:uncharacterized repeat protein (TIGR03803 family)